MLKENIIHNSPKLEMTEVSSTGERINKMWYINMMK